MASHRTHQPLSQEEENGLARRWQTFQDESALARLVETHLGLVIRIALEYRNSGPRMEDLIQEGNLGLVIAARRFDPAENARLATYATYWIRAMILECIVRSHGPVRIGTTRAQRKIYFNLGRTKKTIEGRGETATAEKLAAELGVEEGDVEDMMPRLSGRDISLDAPRSFDDRRSAGDMITVDAPTPEEIIASVEEDLDERERFRATLKILDPREHAIITARHLRAKPATLARLGKKFGISRERVRQLELRAQKKIREALGLEEPVFRAPLPPPPKRARRKTEIEEPAYTPPPRPEPEQQTAHAPTPPQPSNSASQLVARVAKLEAETGHLTQKATSLTTVAIAAFKRRHPTPSP